MFELKKIGFIRRASALLLDAILLTVLATGFMFLMSLICNYTDEAQRASDYVEEWDNFRKEHIPVIAGNYGFIYQEEEDGGNYKVTKLDSNGNGQDSTIDEVVFALIKDVAESYDFTVKLSNDGTSFSILNGDEVSSLSDVLNALNSDESRDDSVANAFKAYLELPAYSLVNAQRQYVYTLQFVIISVSILLAYLILEFVLPLILKNGQTVGKKVFSIGLVRPNCVKVNALMLFARTVLGKYAIETMFPILLVFLLLYGGIGLVAIVLLAAITLLNVILFFATKNKTPIHDVIAGTVATDLKLQMIYQSEEELNEKKRKDYLNS